MGSLGRHLNLQAKILLVLVAVIVPTFLIITLAQNKFTKPLLEQEIRQLGINAGKRLAAEIVSSRLLYSANPSPAVDNTLQDVLYSQPDILRIDVAAKDSGTGKLKLIATNIEEDPGTPDPEFPLVEDVVTEYKTEESGQGIWEILIPIEQKSRDPKGTRKLLGTVHVVVSTNLVDQIAGTIWRTTAAAAVFSVISLILGLSYFLRKTIENDRKLRQAESHNIELTEQLHEAQRQLVITEKLAVMGQLTASFAHEIGTPLNAIGGHLQLLKEDISPELKPYIEDRFQIVESQLDKIAGIVKSFLQTTAKPVFQKQLVDLNPLVEKCLSIVAPRIESLGIEVKKRYDSKLTPIRVVPLDIEQILLNLLNNSLDSIKSKEQKDFNEWGQVQITTSLIKKHDRKWVQISLQDTGEGIPKSDLKAVTKPFFTTKRPGEGTGLGLTICQQLAMKYEGELLIDSKEGAWTRVTLQLPCSASL